MSYCAMSVVGRGLHTVALLTSRGSPPGLRGATRITVTCIYAANFFRAFSSRLKESVGGDRPVARSNADMIRFGGRQG